MDEYIGYKYCSCDDEHYIYDFTSTIESVKYKNDYYIITLKDRARLFRVLSTTPLNMNSFKVGDLV